MRYHVDGIKGRLEEKEFQVQVERLEWTGPAHIDPLAPND
jgi:hypothetical protein